MGSPGRWDGGRNGGADRRIWTALQPSFVEREIVRASVAYLHIMRRTTHLGLVFALVGISATSAHGQWTQFGGPGRDFHSPAGALASTWPENGPPVAWRRELGDGYAQTLVDGKRLYSMYRRAGLEVIVCMARDTGSTLWEHEYPVVTHSSAQQYGDGPSATPAISGERLVTVGVGIDVHCFDKASGEILWSHDIMEEFEIPMPGRGYSPSPLIWEGFVILAVGGTDESNAIDDTANLGLDGGAVVALDIGTGEIVWANQNYPGSKASPLLIEFDGQEQVVVFMGNEMAGLELEYGEVLWRHPHATDFGFNCSTPVFDGVDTLVCSSAYGKPAEAVRLVAGDQGIQVEKLWSSRRMSLHFTNMLLVNRRLYGVSGMGRPGMLTCLDLDTGEMLWRTRGFSKANLISAGSAFVIFDEDGRLALTTFTDDGPEIHGSLVVTDSHGFTAPTLVGSELYVRDRTHLTRFDLAPHARGASFQREQGEQPSNLAELCGVFTCESEGREPQELRIRVVDGGLVLEIHDEELVPLAYQLGDALWEFVSDRTSGSVPRTLEFERGPDGVTAFTLESPFQRARTYQLTGS
ncbi:MAG: outer membrane protein assembly factor BamB [Chlamydiales bacterium]|jgi:outer membrane protein assembly factor BamB